jgi:hypothetical protein
MLNAAASTEYERPVYENSTENRSGDASDRWTGGASGGAPIQEREIETKKGQTDYAAVADARKAAPASLAEVAQVVWNRIVRWANLADGGDVTFWKEQIEPIGGKAANDAVQAIGGYDAIRRTPPEKLAFLKADFIKSFLAEKAQEAAAVNRQTP